MRVEDRIDAMLDHAIEMTFPASDPFTVYFPEVEPGESRPSSSSKSQSESSAPRLREYASMQLA
jgi:hypothetical protein